MEQKLISICMPVYNGGETLKSSLSSLLAQTYKNIELIISDNASTDNTSIICKEFVKKDPRVRYIKQKTNIGSINNFQAVLKEAKGEYFMWAADDDWWHPDFILHLKNILDKNPEYGLAMSSFKGGPNNKRVHKFIGLNNPTNLKGFELFRYAGSGFRKNKGSMLFYSLFRKDFLDKFFYRPLVKNCKSPERLMLGEMALSTKFYTIPDVLWAKGKITDERYQMGIKIIKGDSYTHSFYRHAFLLLARVLTSKNIAKRDKWVVIKNYPKILSDLKYYFIYRDLRFFIYSFWLGRKVFIPIIKVIRKPFSKNN
jgi:glycosyltransferase involved in cell wall biosynthesis